MGVTEAKVFKKEKLKKKREKKKTTGRISGKGKKTPICNTSFVREGGGNEKKGNGKATEIELGGGGKKNQVGWSLKEASMGKKTSMMRIGT